MISVLCEVPVYETDGKDIPVGKTVKMSVEGHWNRDEMVVLRIGDQRVTVLARDMEAALRNATTRGQR